MAVRVIAPAVQVMVGHRARHILRGGVLPEGVAEADMERLLRKGMVETVAAEPETAEEAPAAAEAIPEPEKKPQARKPAAK